MRFAEDCTTRTAEDRVETSAPVGLSQPYCEAHFATFPEDLIKPRLLAGSRLDDTVLDPFGGSGTRREE